MAQLFGLARLGRDAELRSTSSGEQVANLSLAFNYGRKGQDGRRPSQWVEGALWGKLAEAISPYLLKGTSVAVTLDDVHIETFEGRDGPGHKLTGRVTAIDLAGGGERSAAPAPAPRQAPQRQAQHETPRRAGAAPAGSSGFDDMDDDIPW